MSIAEAFVGAKAELAAIRNPIEKAIRAVRIGQIVADELLGTLRMVPYGYRALRLQRTLPDGLSEGSRRTRHSVHIVRDVPYGGRKRNTMDIYLPPEGVGSPSGALKRPVALFVHGGVWASGEKWHYAPMATRLAQAGVMAIVMQYTLYPKALVPELVTEVSRALSWTLDNAEKLDGDPSKVSLIGHSAGAHLCSMALLHRASAPLAAHGTAPPASAPATPCPGPPPAARPPFDQARSHAAAPLLESQPPDPRMPHQAILINGVYDIARHYQYERQRGVHELSTMRRAIGGFSQFARWSPVVLLGQVLQAAGGRARQPWDAMGALAGETIPRYLGLDVPSRSPQGPTATCGPTTTTGSHSPLTADTASSCLEAGLLTMDDIRKLPRTVLMSSCTDLVVPWYESADMCRQLQECGLPAQQLVYNKVAHAEFVTRWPALPGRKAAWGAGTAGGSVLQGLPDYARDLVLLVTR